MGVVTKKIKITGLLERAEQMPAHAGVLVVEHPPADDKRLAALAGRHALVGQPGDNVRSDVAQ